MRGMRKAIRLGTVLRTCGLGEGDDARLGGSGVGRSWQSALVGRAVHPGVPASGLPKLCLERFILVLTFQFSADRRWM